MLFTRSQRRAWALVPTTLTLKTDLYKLDIRKEMRNGQPCLLIMSKFNLKTGFCKKVNRIEAVGLSLMEAMLSVQIRSKKLCREAAVQAAHRVPLLI